MGKKAKKAKAPEIVELEHDRYLIKAGLLQNRFVARAFPKTTSKFRHLVADTSGDTADDAIKNLIEKLESLRMERRSLRRNDPSLPSGVPTTEEYADALRTLSPGPKVLRVLHHHAFSRRRGMQLQDLAKVAEFGSVADLLSTYERLGRDLCKVIEPEETVDIGLPFIMHIDGETAVEMDDIKALQPELQDAVLLLLGSDRRPD